MRAEKGSFKKQFKAIVTPLQFGVAVSDAVNSIAFTMRQYYEVLQTEPQLGLMQIDLCNAFNSVDRTPILQFVCSKLPEASAWAEWVLCAAAPLYLGTRQLLCTTGIQQGDPMGPLLFAAGIHEIISKVAAEYPGAWSIWYLDDGTIVGDHTTLNAVAGRLNDEFARIGLAAWVRVFQCSGAQ